MVPIIDKFPSGRKRDDIHSQLKGNLAKVPGMEEVWLTSSQTGIEYRVVGTINTMIYADGVIPADEAALYIDWFPQPDPPDRFYFHYVDESGYDCGWHRQYQEHVSGLDHFQERGSPEEEYEYSDAEFYHSNPVGILWEIAGERLPNHLEDRY